MITKEKLKTSFDAKWRLHQVKIYLGITLFVFIASILISIFTLATKINEIKDYDINAIEMIFSSVGIIMLVYGIIFIPSLIYYLVKYFKIVNNKKEPEEYTVILDKPSTSYFYRGAIYYTVKFRRTNGESVTIDTKPFFSSAILSKFRLEDYNNKKVTILYYPEEDEIIVLDVAK